jgi:cobalt-zinc-cadmium efflux system protein
VRWKKKVRVRPEPNANTRAFCSNQRAPNMNCHSEVTEVRNLDRRLWISAALNLTITLVELAGGILSGSLALLADAMHNFADAGALGVAIFARWLGRQAPTPQHTYGFKRAEILAALVNAAALIAISSFIGRDAIHRLLHPEPIRTSIMMGAAVVALAANLASVALLKAHSHDDINVRSAFLHLAQDALASCAVVAAAALSGTPIGSYVDPAAAILVGFVVLRSAFSILKESLHTLLEGTPADLHVGDLAQAVSERFPNVGLHHIHVWEVGPSQRVLTAHMKIAGTSIVEAEGVAAELRRYLGEEWGIDHATLEAEANGCGKEALLGAWR